MHQLGSLCCWNGVVPRASRHGKYETAEEIWEWKKNWRCPSGRFELGDGRHVDSDTVLDHLESVVEADRLSKIKQVRPPPAIGFRVRV